NTLEEENLTTNHRFLGVADADLSHPLPIYQAPVAGPPEVRIRDPLVAHLQDVSAVELYVDLPAEWLAIRDRWAALVGSAFKCRQLLADAVVNGSGDLAQLNAQALAETNASSETEAEVRRHVGSAVCGALKALYAPIALTAYKRI